jgi:tetratricopeptide (TPR) repeat protein/ferredoxin
MPIPKVRSCSTPSAEGISLPVLKDPKHTIRKSKMGRRRAAVLITVHLAIAVHVVHWLIKGRTLSPVEPSESMYTINNGALNAGFVFFGLAILSTVLFGRFFCGWGCHIIAVQDFCAYLMKKCGVKPRPFRSRLLLWAPLALALYMFVWPTFKREVIRPALGPGTWASVAPFVGEVGERPEITAAFVKKSFWETFAPWYVAIPFIGVCGFACVYFLGAKGFCTYGCPYGGFFGPVDRISIGRIRVTDACEHCGHCTAVCTSNVRVHEEVRDFGMVVDPGCMKCMDCVSVCPNNALYFGFGRPAAGAKRRVEGPAAFKSRVYDLSWKEEVLYGLSFLALVIGFRGMLGLVPLLMAMGLAGIATFLLWKLIAMFRLPSVRLQSLQLKIKGVFRAPGILTAALAIGLLATGVWGLIVNASLWRGNALDDLVSTPMEAALTPGFTPTESDRTLSTRAARLLTLAAPPSQGGIGWDRSIDRSIRLARLHAIAGNFAGAEAALRAGLAIAPDDPPQSLEAALVKVLGLRAISQTEIESKLRELLAHHPKLASARLLVAKFALTRGAQDEAITSITSALADRPDNDLNRVFAAQLLVQSANRPDLGLSVLADGVRLNPKNAMLREQYGLLLEATGSAEAALPELKAAADLNPTNLGPPRHVARILRVLGRETEAAQWDARVQKLESTGSPAGRD